MPAPISEDDIERALLAKLLADYNIEQLNCFTANSDDLNDGSGRAKKTDVLLVQQLRAALPALNQHIPEDQRRDVIDRAIDKLMAPAEGSPIDINRQMDGWMRDGIPDLSFNNAQNKTESCSVYLIDFKQPANNSFLAVSQLWIKSQGAQAKANYRRPDVILYVNGLPLVFIELKNSNVKLKTAYSVNLAEYKNDIPQLFYFNAFCILSNALNTKVGAYASDWDYFFDWLRVSSEKEKIDRKKIESAGTSLEYAIEGLLEPSKLLDYVENFIVYQNESTKIIAQSHQLLGVNRAFDRFKNRDDYPEDERSKLGVFWHTQGSGKSYSMVFYMRKINRKLQGNYRFLVVTDRKDLDTQIYKNFLATATINAKDAVMPKNGEQLKEFLTQNKRIVFTLIHKFHSPKGKTFPTLSEADDWVVMVDEAHRTQYKSLAENMRKALPNANYIAFTGTPLLGKQRKTHKWFGDYVSEYSFQQAMDDGATLPLFYQKRVPSVLIENDDLDEEFLELLEDDDLTTAQREKLEKKYATELSVIKGDDRLEVIAKDLVYHFPRRGYRGKAMMICVDKFTAVKMYNKVQYHWKEAKKDLQKRIKRTSDELEKRRLDHILSYMKGVDMAVVVSHDANDVERFQKKDLDIKPHAKRMESTDANGWDIEDQFKAPEHELQLVFVCAMWLTGFDAPSVSTLYLDKPMKDHTLMQAIARANRVSSYMVKGVTGKLVEKKNGEVIDYYNVFRNMKKALRDYGVGDDGEESPIQDKSRLFVLLEEAIEATHSYCLAHDIDLSLVLSEHAETAFKKVALFQEFANNLLGAGDHYRAFYVFQNTVAALYEACRPEINESNYYALRQQVAVIQYLRKIISDTVEEVDVEKYEPAIEDLLDDSIVVDDDAKEKMAAEKAGLYTHSIIKSGNKISLQNIDFEKLKDEIKKAEYKNIEISDLRAFLERKLAQMLKENSERKGFADRLRAIIDRYNSGATSTDDYMDELLSMGKELSVEEERHIRLGLTEDELELFDLLMKDKLTKAEEEEVKLAAKSLIPSLKEAAPKVLLDRWYQDRQNTERVRNRISDCLNESLPQSYDTEVFRQKCDATLNLVTDLAKQGRKWAA
ncbi:type I restriction endonuclease subunit R [Leucothrix pacifica]|uniref:Type I restriction enzyme endonuclease subunit n=1 Tax=Leucothrix pacifica TaxID=1247513 RepID=A0A317C9H5_9GAMM|nr:type I restriction endonuclease subunit R [Leucothrix pacifica]PWQ93030.1 deoxyribonuclease [Leucothrix pacifica]